MTDSTDAAYEKAAEANPGDGEFRHNVEDCDGEFRAVWGPTDDLNDDGPQAVVCAGCGAWRPVSDMDDEPEGPGVMADA